MNLLRPLIDRFFPPIQPLPAGIYHYQAPADSDFPYRLHLRLEPDGEGVLIVNASTIVHLNRTAAEYAYHLVRGTPENVAIAEISRRYRIARDTVEHDYNDLIERLMTLIDTPDLDPISYLNFDRSELYSGANRAPYRLDCALTYRLPETSQRPAAPEDRVSRELSEQEWQTVLEKAWSAGIPHVVFTGGEPTLRDDLTGLIHFAEGLGMVSGLITGGQRLAQPGYLTELLQSGLDHIMLLLDPDQETLWESLKALMDEDIAVVVHLTLSQANLPRLNQTLDRLVELGVAHVSLSGDSPDLAAAVQASSQALADRSLRLVRDLPVPYSQFHPVELELAQEQDEVAPDEGAGRAWLYVEPDGDLLPGQGHYKAVLGNLLSDPWQTLWAQAGQAHAEQVS